MIEQRSEEWFNIRKGKITSSEIHKIMGKPKSKSELLSETAKTYLLTNISELLGGVNNQASGPGLERGTELEDDVVEVYEKIRGIKVDKASFIQVNDCYGGSPDGIVSPDGCIEIKVPINSINHLKHGLISSPEDFKDVATPYYYQCMSHMICTGAKWCDFISYDPRVELNHMLYIFRLDRNEEEITYMKEKIDISIEYMKELQNKLNEIVSK